FPVAAHQGERGRAVDGVVHPILRTSGGPSSASGLTVPAGKVSGGDGSGETSHPRGFGPRHGRSAYWEGGRASALSVSDRGRPFSRAEAGSFGQILPGF